MIKFEEEMINILQDLDKSNILPYCIISGSWSLYFYKFLFDNFVPPIATTDFDIFLPDVRKIKESNISSILSEREYYRNDDILSGKTTFLSKDGFEIEFLTLPKRNSNNVLIVEGLRIGAEVLPKLAPLKENYITVIYHGMNINIPSPSSYCLQKLLINKDRKQNKQLKDIDGVKYVLNFINASKKYSDEFISLYMKFPKKWKNSVDCIIKEYSLLTPISK